MKKVVTYLIGLFLFSTILSAQTKGPTITLVAATSHSVGLTWNAPQAVVGGWSGCGSPSTCTYQIATMSGSCPSVLVGSTGWLPFTTMVASLTFTDTTEVAGSTNSYIVYTYQTIGGVVNHSDPSNCVTVTLPYAPVAPTVTATGS